MLVTQAIETSEGTVTFQGELLKEELDFIIEVGLNVVMANGVTPFLSSKNKKADLAVPATNTEQPH
jgi:hypothetical protein